MNNSKKQIKLMMTAAYHREVYDCFISSEIPAAKLVELNAAIDVITESLKLADDTLRQFAYHGELHTNGLFFNMANKVLEINNKIHDVKKLVNMKTPSINPDDYPLN